MRCWVCSLSHRMESSCHRALGEPELSSSGLEGDKKMRRTPRVNVHLHHSPSRPAGPRPSRDSCPLAQAQAPWPKPRILGPVMTELGRGRRAPKKYAVVPTLPRETDPGDTRVFPKGAVALTAHWSYSGRTAPHSGRQISVDIPVDIVVDNFVD
jgi:hypothetical protein